MIRTSDADTITLLKTVRPIGGVVLLRREGDTAIGGLVVAKEDGGSINWKPTTGRRRSKTVRGVLMPDVFRTGEGTRGLMSFRPNT